MNMLLNNLRNYLIKIILYPKTWIKLTLPFFFEKPPLPPTEMTEILVLGDSHATVFRNKAFKMQFPDYFFHIVSISGATVSGLENPQSKTQALPIFMVNLQKSQAKIVIVLLGEVDVGFVIWYRANKYNAPVEIMLEKAIKNYQNLLTKISKQHQVICISTPLPTIEDGNDWGEVASARKEVKATQVQRTNLTLEFNRIIQDFCQKNNFSYISIDQDSLGENGLVKPELVNVNPNDHHYRQRKYAELIIDKLKYILQDDCTNNYS
jgi:hypothetical protein